MSVLRGFRGTQPTPSRRDFRLFSSVARFLKDAARACPVALILDDIHDADQSSLRMLQFVARELRDAHVVIVATFREAEVERSKTLGPLIARIAREGTHLPLRGLVEPDVAEFVSTRCAIAPAPGLITTLHRATDGNPLFLEGVVRMLIVEGKLGDAHEIASSELKLPAGVRVAIRKQVGSLSEAAQAMLSIASALGNEFDLRLLERVAAPGETSGKDTLQRLDESLAAGILIREQGSRRRYRFAHALIRATIYDALSPTERIRTHRVIADALEELCAPDLVSHVSDLAHHYIEAIASGTRDKAIDYSIKAGNSAMSVFAYEEAISHWERAVGVIEENGGLLERKADLLTNIGTILQQIDTHKGVAHLEAALTLYEALHDQERAADLHQRLGLFRSSPGAHKNLPLASMHLHKAEAFLSKGASSGSLAAVYFGLGQLARCEFRTREAVAYLRRATEVAEAAGANGEWCGSAVQYGLYLSQIGRLSEARAIATKVWERISTIESPLSTFGAYYAGGGISSELCDQREARGWWQRGRDDSRLARYQHQMMSILVGYCAVWMGELPLHAAASRKRA